MEAIIYHKWEDKRIVLNERMFELLYEITNWNEEEVLIATWSVKTFDDLKEMCNKNEIRYTILNHASGALGIILKEVHFKISFKELPVTKDYAVCS